MQIHTTLRHYAHIIRQRIVFILLGIAICTSTTSIISLSIPPVYQAKTLLKVNSTATNNNNDIYSAQAIAVDYALLVTSSEVLREAAKKLPGVTIDKLQQVISDSPVENTQIIEIRAQADNPQVAADRANTIANVFIQLQASDETNRLQDSANQVTQHITAARLSLDTAQTYLNILQNSHATQASIAQQHSLVDTDQANYGLLLTDYSQLQVQKLQAATILSIAQPAQAPDAPISSQALPNILLAAVMSLLLMLLLVLLLDWLDTTVKTGEDIVNMTGLTPLGSIPLIHQPESANLLNLTAQHNALVHEALNMLGISLSMQLNRRRFLLVSGTRAGVGASTVATYLALSLAQAGIRVLLLDANLHRPLLHDVFRISNANGLSNRMSDIERFQEQPAQYPGNWLNHWKTAIANLWLLPAGPPAKPSVHAARQIQDLRQLKGWLLGEQQTTRDGNNTSLVDLILCDTAPLGEGSDTYALSIIADGVIMVIEAAKEQKEALCCTHTLHLKAPILGVVINRHKAGQTTYYYANQHNGENTATVTQKTHVIENTSNIQTSPPRKDSSPYEEQIVNDIPVVPLRAPHTFSHKVPERPITQAFTFQPKVTLPSTAKKLVQITKLIPQTPILPLLTVNSTYNEHMIIESQPKTKAKAPGTETPAPFSLYTGAGSIFTDPLVEMNAEVEQEAQIVRTPQPFKTQFRARPNRRV
jgi:non-specific protein-tyrosine kinase